MHKTREKTTVGIKKSMQSGMSHCLFGDWPRRALLKLPLPVKDWPRPFHVSEETMTINYEIS